MKAQLEKNFHSLYQGKSLAARQCSCGSCNDLLKLAHPTAFGINQEDSCSFLSIEKKDVLWSRASSCTTRGTAHISCLQEGMIAVYEAE